MKRGRANDRCLAIRLRTEIVWMLIALRTDCVVVIAGYLRAFKYHCFVFQNTQAIDRVFYGLYLQTAI